MNHKITTEYMLEGLQDRIDKLAFNVWSRKEASIEIEYGRTKKFNAKNYSLTHIHTL